MGTTGKNLYFFALFNSILVLQANTLDPYSKIKSGHLSNGIRYILAPSEKAKNVYIKIVFTAGHFSEERGQAGIAHLTEHALFEDKSLGENKNYTNIIEENGGSTNAYTKDKQTEYFITIAPEKLNWALEIYSKMFVNKKFEDTLIQKEKAIVFQEIGQPQNLDILAGPVIELFNKFMSSNDYKSTVFKIKTPPPLNHALARINTSKFSTQTVIDFYTNYYHAKNMKIFVAGNFEPKVVVKRLERLFRAIPQSGRDGWIEPKSLSKINSVYRNSVSEFKPKFQLGFLVNDLTYEEELIGRMYFEDLAYRLQKTIRNTNGESYSINFCPDLVNGYGKMTLCLDSSRASFNKNLALVRKHLKEELHDEKLDENYFTAASDMYGKRFAKIESDSVSQMEVINELYRIDKFYPNQTLNPYKTYNNIDLILFKSTLKKIFRPDQTFTHIENPTLYFHLEKLMLSILSLFLGVYLARKLFVRPFIHSHVRGVRKLSEPMPLYILMASIGLITIGAFSAFVLAEFLWFVSGLKNFHFLISEYLKILVTGSSIVLMSQYLLGRVFIKAYLCESSLVLKSCGFFSDTIPLAKIRKIELISQFALFRDKSKWKRVGTGQRHSHHDWPWIPGTYIELRNGSAYFLGIKNSKKFVEELSEQLGHKDATKRKAA